MARSKGLAGIGIGLRTGFETGFETGFGIGFGTGFGTGFGVRVRGKMVRVRVRGSGKG